MPSIDQTQHKDLLTIRDVAVSFKTVTGTVEAVKGASYSVAKGETLAVVGESGSGKSVTARAIMGMLLKTPRWRKARTSSLMTVTWQV